MVDITPDARVLKILGRLPMEPWQCIAELIDNGIDGYANADKNWKKKHGEKVEIHVYLPTEEQLKSGNGKIVVVDYGPGMDKTQLANSVRAGWSGNVGYDRLGLFGMGFNIATAKLGSKTRVHSARESDEFFEWIDIDPDAMRAHQRIPGNEDQAFEAAEGQSPKDSVWSDGQVSVAQIQGTKIEITSLSIDKVMPLISDKAFLREKLGRIYSPLMERVDIDIRIHFPTSGNSGDRVKRWKHCRWMGDEHVASVKVGNRYENIPLYKELDIHLGDDYFCKQCWEWFDYEIKADTCPECKAHSSIEKRARKITGWLGVQRFFSGPDDNPQNHFGIDLVRNGRVIEELNKDFFSAPRKDGGTRNDYPVEGYGLGRIIGSIEINFCPTEPEKGQFEREDPNWERMLEAMRGNGLRPIKTAEEWGEFIPTDLSKMVSGWGSAKAERGYSPIKKMIPAIIQWNKKEDKPKIDAKTQLPYQISDFKGPIKMYKKFLVDPSYDSDEKWLSPIEESDDFDAEVWYENWKKENGIEDPKPKKNKCKKHGRINCKQCKYNWCDHAMDPIKCPICSKETPDHWEFDDYLSAEYTMKHGTNEKTFIVSAYNDNQRNRNSNPPLEVMRISGKGTERKVVYHKHHIMFETYKEDPIDYLLLELAADFKWAFGNKGPSVSECYMYLKENYCSNQKIDLDSMKNQAEVFLEDIREIVLKWKINAMNDCSADLQQSVRDYFAREQESMDDAEKALENGDFVKFISSKKLFEEILRNKIPELCDGVFFATELKRSSGATKNFQIDSIISALRTVCYAESRQSSSTEYHDLIAIQNAINRLRSWK